MEMIEVKKVPKKTDEEKRLRDYYMYFIRGDEGINQNIINQFNEDVKTIKQENDIYQKVIKEDNDFILRNKHLNQK